MRSANSDYMDSWNVTLNRTYEPFGLQAIKPVFDTFYQFIGSKIDLEIDQFCRQKN